MPQDDFAFTDRGITVDPDRNISVDRPEIKTDFNLEDLVSSNEFKALDTDKKITAVESFGRINPEQDVRGFDLLINNRARADRSDSFDRNVFDNDLARLPSLIEQLKDDNLSRMERGRLLQEHSETRNKLFKEAAESRKQYREAVDLSSKKDAEINEILDGLNTLTVDGKKVGVSRPEDFLTKKGLEKFKPVDEGGFFDLTIRRSFGPASEVKGFKDGEETNLVRQRNAKSIKDGKTETNTPAVNTAGKLFFTNRAILGDLEPEDVKDPSIIKQLSNIKDLVAVAENKFSSSDFIQTNPDAAFQVERDASLLRKAREDGKTFYLDDRGVFHVANADKLILSGGKDDANIDALNVTKERKAQFKNELKQNYEFLIHRLADKNLLAGNLFFKKKAVNTLSDGTEVIDFKNSEFEIANASGARGTLENVGSILTGQSPDNLDLSGIAAFSFDKQNKSGLLTFEQKEKIVLDEIKDSDGFVSKVLAGLDQGTFGAANDAITTGAQLLGDSNSADVAKFFNESRQSAEEIDQITPDNTFDKVTETFSQVAPQIFLTRGVGSAAFKATGSAKAASAAAIGVGASQSFVQGAKTVLDKDPTAIGDAYLRGFASFATTALVTAGFQKVAGGGVEGNFEPVKASLTKELTKNKSALLAAAKRLGGGAISEGGEEFIDEFIQGMITQDYSGKSDGDIVKDALFAALIGSKFGAITSAKPAIQEFNSTRASNQKVVEEADRQMVENTIREQEGKSLEFTDDTTQGERILNAQANIEQNTNEESARLQTKIDEADSDTGGSVDSAAVPKPKVDTQKDSPTPVEGDGARLEDGETPVSANAATPGKVSTEPSVQGDNEVQGSDGPVQSRSETPSHTDNVKKAVRLNKQLPADQQLANPSKATKADIDTFLETNKDVEVAPVTEAETLATTKTQAELRQDLATAKEVLGDTGDVSANSSLEQIAEFLVGNKEAIAGKAPVQNSEVVQKQAPNVEAPAKPVADTPAKVEAKVEEAPEATNLVEEKINPEVELASVNKPSKGSVTVNPVTLLEGDVVTTPEGRFTVKGQKLVSDEGAVAPIPNRSRMHVQGVERIAPDGTLVASNKVVPKNEAGTPKVVTETLNEIKRKSGADKVSRVAAPSKGHNKMANNILKALGRNVIYFKADGASTKIDGVAFSGDPNTIYVNADHVQPLMHIIGHEIAHTLENVAEYAKLKQMLIDGNPEAFAQFKKDNKNIRPEDVQDEFVADFVGSRFTDVGFWSKLHDDTSTSVFQNFVKYAQKVLGDVRAFLQGFPVREVPTELINNLDVLDTTLGLMLESEVNGISPSDTAKYMLSVVPDAGGKNPQSNGIINTQIETQPKSFQIVQEFIAEQEGFDHSQTPLNEEGIAQAEAFFDKVITEGDSMQNRLAEYDSDFSGNDSAVLPGIANAAYIAFATRLFKEGNPKLQERALDMVERAQGLANDVTVKLESNVVDRSEIGRILRSFGSVPGGSLVHMLSVNREGMNAMLEGRLSELGLKAVQGLETKIRKHTVSEENSDKIADDAVNTLDSEEAFKKIKKAEGDVKKFISAAVPILKVLQSLQGSKVKASEVSSDNAKETSIDRALRMALGVESGDVDIFEAVDALNSIDQAELDALGAKAKELEKIRKKTNKASEDATDAKANEFEERADKATSEVDKAAKRVIRETNKYGEPAKPETEKSKKAKADREAFKKLSKRVTDNKLSEDRFTQDFLEIGGSLEIATDAYLAIKKKARRTAEVAAKRAEAKKSKKLANAEEELKKRAERVEKEAEGKITSFVKNLLKNKKEDSLGLGVDTNASPTKKPSIARVKEKFTNLKSSFTESNLVPEIKKDLRNIKSRDGKSRLLSEENVDFLANEIAKLRKAKQEKRQSDLAANRAKQDASRLEREVKAIEKSFEPKPPKDPNAKPKRATSVRSLIKEFLKDPRVNISDAKGRAELLEKVLRTNKPSLTDAQIARLVKSTMDNFTKLVAEERLEIAKKALSTLVETGKITEADLSRLVKLQVFDPKNNVVSSIAALQGWGGLSSRDLAVLSGIQQEIFELGGAGRVVTRLYNKQARLILSAANLPPVTKAFLNSYIRAGMYSGISSHAIGITSGIFKTFETFISQATWAVQVGVTHPELALEHTGLLLRSFARASWRGLQESGYSVVTGTTANLQAVQQGTDQEAEAKNLKGQTGEAEFVDSLTRAFDTYKRRFRKAREDRNPVEMAKTMVGLAASSQFVVFRALGAVDSAFTLVNSQINSELEASKALIKVGASKGDISKLFKDAQADYGRVYDSLRNDRKLSRLAASLQAKDVIDGKIHDELMDRGVDFANLKEAFVAEAQDAFGVGKTSKSAIGELTSAFANLSNRLHVVGPLLFKAVRTTGNVADYMAWHTPIGFLRAYDFSQMYKGKVRRKTLEEVEDIFPNVKHELVLGKRRRGAFVGTALIGLVTSLLAANDDLEDEDKWFWFTGGYPVFNPEKQKQWDRNGWKPNELILFGRHFEIDRGIGSWLAMPMLVGSTVHNLTEGDLKSTADDVTGLISMGASGVDQSASLLRNVRKDINNPNKLIVAPAVRAVPFHALLQTSRKLQDPIDRKNSEPGSAVEEFLDVFYIDKNREGVVVAKNVFGEEVKAANGDIGVFLSRIGAAGLRPFFGHDGNNHPETAHIKKLFFEKGYNASVPSYKSFIITKAGKDSSGEARSVEDYKKYMDARAKGFKAIVNKNLASLKDLESQEFKNKMKSLVTKNNKEAAKVFSK